MLQDEVLEQLIRNQIIKFKTLIEWHKKNIPRKT